MTAHATEQSRNTPVGHILARLKTERAAVAAAPGRGVSFPPSPVMLIKRPSGSFIDVFDRVLDRGIVIDGWMQVSLSGLDLVTVELRMVVASIETYLQYADPLSHSLSLSSSVSAAARPPGIGSPHPAGKSPLS